jgi:hypothetical protein
MSAKPKSTCRFHALERQQHVHHLLAVTRLLNVADLAVAAISDTGLRDLAGIDGVVALDVFRPHDAGNDQLAWSVMLTVTVRRSPI